MPGNDPDSLGKRFAQNVLQEASGLHDDAAMVQAALGRFLDTEKSEDERLTALNEMSRGRIEVDALSAAITLGSESGSAQTRRRVWSTLRRSVYDPTLAGIYSYVLLSDPDEGVRREAVLALATYIDEPDSRSSLRYAMQNDVSEDIRLTAQLATMTAAEREQFKRDRLLDRELAPTERIAPTLTSQALDPTLRLPAFGNAPIEEAVALAEIASAIEDPNLKSVVLSQLSLAILFPDLDDDNQMLDARIVDTLMESANSDNERVRQIALDTLRRHSEAADVGDAVRRLRGEMTEPRPGARLADLPGE